MVASRASVRGQGGFILTVSPADNDAPEAERLIPLTAATHIRKRR